MIRQVSVFIQNQEGRLAHVLRTLAEENINIRSLTIAETADYGIMRLILQDTEKGLAALKAGGVMANVTRVMAAEVPDTPGGLSQLVDKLTEGHVNIEYAYSFLPHKTDNAVIIFKIDDDDITTTEEILAGMDGVNLLTRSELLKK